MANAPLPLPLLPHPSILRPISPPPHRNTTVLQFPVRASITVIRLVIRLRVHQSAAALLASSCITPDMSACLQQRQLVVMRPAQLPTNLNLKSEISNLKFPLTTHHPPPSPSTGRSTASRQMRRRIPPTHPQMIDVGGELLPLLVHTMYGRQHRTGRTLQPTPVNTDATINYNAMIIDHRDIIFQDRPYCTASSLSSEAPFCTHGSLFPDPGTTCQHASTDGASQPASQPLMGQASAPLRRIITSQPRDGIANNPIVKIALLLSPLPEFQPSVTGTHLAAATEIVPQSTSRGRDNAWQPHGQMQSISPKDLLFSFLGPSSGTTESPFE